MYRGLQVILTYMDILYLLSNTDKQSVSNPANFAIKNACIWNYDRRETLNSAQSALWLIVLDSTSTNWSLYSSQRGTKGKNLILTAVHSEFVQNEKNYAPLHRQISAFLVPKFSHEDKKSLRPMTCTQCLTAAKCLPRWQIFESACCGNGEAAILRITSLPCL